VVHASGGDDIDREADLTESLHRVLATLIEVRHDHTALPVDHLRERLQLVQWLRAELAAVEALVRAEYDRVRLLNPTVRADGAPTVQAGGAPASGPVSR
jgi:hypothetical protein